MFFRITHMGRVFLLSQKSKNGSTRNSTLAWSSRTLTLSLSRGARNHVCRPRTSSLTGSLQTDRPLCVRRCPPTPPSTMSSISTCRKRRFHFALKIGWAKKHRQEVSPPFQAPWTMCLISTSRASCLLTPRSTTLASVSQLVTHLCSCQRRTFQERSSLPP